MSTQQPTTVMPSNMMPPPDSQQDLSQANSYYPQEPNDLTGGLPINLDSLRDGPPGSKPFYPYSTLIRSVHANFERGDVLSAVLILLPIHRAVTRSKVLRIKNCFWKIFIMPSSLV